MKVNNSVKGRIRKTVLLACVAGLLSAPLVQASDGEEGYTHYPSTTKERKGLGWGALLGGLAGGPPGAILGAFGGSAIGRQMSMEEQLNRTRSELEQVRVELQQARLQEAEVDGTAAAARGGVAHKGHMDSPGVMVASAAPLTVQLPTDLLLAIEKGFFITLQFRTAEIRIEPHYQRHLQQLATQLAAMGGLQVYLDGYADERGEDALNLELSERRLQEVKGALLRGGVDEGSIVLRAHGESSPVSGKKDPESLGFERRVVISFARREGL